MGPAVWSGTLSLADECAASAEQGGCPETPRVECTTVTDKECLDAFTTLSRMEGIIPALESAHAMREAPKMGKDQTVLVNLSGRGDKDADFVAAKLGL